MRYVVWLFTLAVALMAAAFAVANRLPVTVDLWPLPLMQQIPVYQLVFGGGLVGLLLGGLATMVGGRKRKAQMMARVRKGESLATDLRLRDARIAELTRELAALQTEKDAADKRAKQNEEQLRQELAQVREQASRPQLVNAQPPAAPKTTEISADPVDLKTPAIDTSDIDIPDLSAADRDLPDGPLVVDAPPIEDDPKAAADARA